MLNLSCEHDFFLFLTLDRRWASVSFLFILLFASPIFAVQQLLSSPLSLFLCFDAELLYSIRLSFHLRQVIMFATQLDELILFLSFFFTSMQSLWNNHAICTKKRKIIINILQSLKALIIRKTSGLRLRTADSEPFNFI